MQRQRRQKTAVTSEHTRYWLWGHHGLLCAASEGLGAALCTTREEGEANSTSDPSEAPRRHKTPVFAAPRHLRYLRLLPHLHHRHHLHLHLHLHHHHHHACRQKRFNELGAMLLSEQARPSGSPPPSPGSPLLSASPPPLPDAAVGTATAAQRRTLATDPSAEHGRKSRHAGHPALAVAPRLGGHHGLVGLHLSRLRAALRTREQRPGSSDATERGRALSAREAVPCRHSRRVLPSSRRWLRAHRVRAAAPVCQLGQNGCLG